MIFVRSDRAAVFFEVKTVSKKRKTPVSVPVQSEQPTRSRLSTFSKVMIALIMVDILVVTLFTILDGAGLHLLIPEIISVGSALVIVLLLVWAGVSVYNRIRSDRAQRIYRIIGLSLGMGLAMFVLVAAAQLTIYAMPHAYGTIESPLGQKVVILRLNDVGAGTEEDYAATLARMNARAAYLSGETVESQPADDTMDAAVEQLESYPEAAYGYVYIAFPRKYGIFYTSSAQLEGEIYRGLDSQSGLFFEWLDDTTVRFYLENPESGDEGEMILTVDSADSH